MKKILIPAIAMLILATPAFAGTTYPDDFTVADTYSENGSATLDDVFNTSNGENPWLKLVLPTDITSYTNWANRDGKVDTTWYYGSTKMFDINENPSGAAKAKDTFWLSPSVGTLKNGPNTVLWDNLKLNYGAWHIDATYEWNLGGGNKIKGDASIPFSLTNVTASTVTPEPISMALFGLGAGVLGLAGIRRKKSL